MQIATRTTDRMALISFLEQETGVKRKYMGAPTFRYVIGPYTVLRNANIETSDEAGAKLKEKLKEKGFVDDDLLKGIIVPFKTETVRARMNLLNMIRAKQDIINKAVAKRALFIKKDFLQRMQDNNPQTLQQFREAMLYNHTDRCMIGFKIYDDQVIFTGFPLDGSTVEQTAMKDLAMAMVRNAEKQRWVKSDTKYQDNEKYEFRGWMLSLGLSGSQYKKTRAILLKNLNGNVAYRTEEQKRKAEEKRKKTRVKAMKEEEKHDDFTIL